MDPETKQAAYHSSAYNAAGGAIMSFTPIKQIHQHICAFHVYSHDHSRHVRADHFCTHLNHEFHQCVIYDSDKPDARLIGIEYIISEKIFESLPVDEKKFWHSHKYEVESGLLQLAPKSFVPGAAIDLAEQPAMIQLQKTYGKTIHTWQYDIHPDLPLGPPTLMTSYTRDGQGPPEDMVKKRDEETGQDTSVKKEVRKGYLPPYETMVGSSDSLQEGGRGIVFEVKEVSAKNWP
ncbi:hypothetical protein DICSQDRAFT_143283 [Dichomitus squalens LYAD-421 SS1]|uniref:uncharacterized protein n=1 Tax=Dichomitus squalens (strain LYAD-421) TaxID=732165 RepID=UPI0004412054|nr:uncharacterized protein DICSQDRAFT_143283 [Dichomitus squalens LYAD-421 SS1]EJF65924.1 hypothetical protein DICSQDRAFT_143283 [Dichomitus squalens LYAD-421 SS1]